MNRVRSVMALQSDADVTLIVPTYNRAYTLRLVMESFYAQKHLAQIIVVDDFGTDDTAAYVEEQKSRHPEVQTLYVRHSQRMGAAQARHTGLTHATGRYILFCDDDDFLEPNYSETCRELVQSGTADIASGRHLYRQRGEPVHQAIQRFGHGLREAPIFDIVRFRVENDAILNGTADLPFTHGILLMRKSLLNEVGVDTAYFGGNGMREETDFQLHAYVRGKRVLMTNATHAVHLHPSEVRIGGQRTHRLSRFYWSVRHTGRLYRKYFNRAAQRLGIRYGWRTAILIYALAEFHNFFLRPWVVLAKRLAGRAT